MNTLKITFGDVRSKRIETPNDFISHMIEHIAWRLGCSIDLQWPNEDWKSLGSSIQNPHDLSDQKISVGVSVEGRKFRRFVPLRTSWDEIRKRLIVGHTVMGGLFSEDLDDFLDGLSWGLGCSLVIHIKDLPPAEAAWSMIFKNLGIALGEVFEVNPYRRGVPPGVKANLS